MLRIFDWLIFHYFLQLTFRLTPLTLAVKSNEKLVNQKLCNTVLILVLWFRWINNYRVLLLVYLGFSTQHLSEFTEPKKVTLHWIYPYSQVCWFSDPLPLRKHLPKSQNRKKEIKKGGKIPWSWLGITSKLVTCSWHIFTNFKSTNPRIFFTNVFF